MSLHAATCMSHHLSRLLVRSTGLQKESFLLKKILLTFLTTWAKLLLSLVGSPVRGRVRDVKEEPWPTMRMTPDAPERKSDAALSVYSSAEGYEAL